LNRVRRRARPIWFHPQSLFFPAHLHCLTSATEPGRLRFRETVVDREAPLKTQTHTPVHPTDITKRECGTKVVLNLPILQRWKVTLQIRSMVIDLPVDDKKLTGILINCEIECP